MTVQNPAPGYPRLIPYLQLPAGQAEAAIAYYTRHLGAKERMRLPMKNQQGQACIGHAELQFGDSVLMLSDFACVPAGETSQTVQILVAVDDIDTVFAQMLAAGSTEIMPLEDRFYGDRTGVLRDPFGHAWHLTQHIRDVGEEEMRAVMAKMNGG